MIKQCMSRQFLLFLLTGGTAAVVNFSSRIFYNQWIDFSLAVIFAYVTGMIIAFVLAKMLVFKDSQQPIKHSIAFFVLVNMVAALQTWTVSMGLAYYLLPSIGVMKYKREISHAVGVALPVFTSYIAHKRWSFQ